MAQCYYPQLVREWITDKDGKKKKTNSFRYVPCGKCIACLSNRRADWTYRLVQEQNKSDLSYFVTLTYADEYIPIECYKNIFFYSFDKIHVQKFFKRLRQKCVRFDKNIKLSYFCISEYGKQTFRSHYHTLIFFKNVDPDMDKHLRQFIAESWPFERKETDIRVTHEANIHYCTKYALKDVTGDYGTSEYFSNNGKMICWSDKAGTYLERPFFLCSTRPYLGSSSEDKIEDHGRANGFDCTEVYFNGFRQHMPRIYRQKVGLEGCSEERSPDPRLSMKKYNAFKQKYDRLQIDQPFADWLDNEIKLREQRQLDVVRRKVEKL